MCTRLLPPLRHQHFSVFIYKIFLWSPDIHLITDVCHFMQVIPALLWWLVALLRPLSSAVKCPLLSKSGQYSASSIVDILVTIITTGYAVTSCAVIEYFQYFIIILVLLSVLNHQKCRRIGRGITETPGQYLIIMGGIHTCI